MIRYCETGSFEKARSGHSTKVDLYIMRVGELSLILWKYPPHYFHSLRILYFWSLPPFFHWDISWFVKNLQIRIFLPCLHSQGLQLEHFPSLKQFNLESISKTQISVASQLCISARGFIVKMGLVLYRFDNYKQRDARNSSDFFLFVGEERFLKIVLN